ncbi:MAG: sulfur oxidation c-type cytochrome SoxX [Gammaproteobacteria bacterium]|nr:sulfur oxidation c-type cytochrome SoxX [Gammaproteobacteria bacterium]
MRNAVKLVMAASVVALFSTAIVPTIAVAGDAEDGKAIAFNRTKGNCLACHAIEGGSLPGNIGPPLVHMKDRFPDKAKLREQIADATRNNPNTIMPPFGKLDILTPDELTKVVDYIYSL